MTTPLRMYPNGLLKPLFFASSLLCTAASAQDTITIGTGTLTNDFASYPAPYGNQLQGARHQMLVLAEELLSAGMSEGELVGLGFELEEASFIEFAGFTVSLGLTDQTGMTTTWVAGLVPVFGPTPFENGTGGWTEHLFDQPFTWDGVSNLVVQTCFRNDDPGFNAVHRQSATSFESTLFRATQNQNVCTGVGVTESTIAQRPNMRFYWNSFDVPPVASFDQSATATCTGAVQFTDASDFQPDSWLWDFGDGTTDTVQNPEHQYTADGVFLPVLVVVNAFGSDTVEGQPITVNISGPTPIAACEPISTGTVAGFGILSITLADLTVTSADALSEGYADRTCQGTSVLAGTNLSVALETGTVATHNVRVWIDWDNSGDFIGTEEVLSATSVMSAGITVAIPPLAVLGTPLRVRFMADYDFSPLPEPCTGPQFGQAEDYALTVLPNAAGPEAAFTATPTLSCDGTIQFTDLSTNIPSSWQWDFGDSGTSNEQSPTYTYLNSGTYDVRLIVTNANGGDTLVQTALITVDLSAQLVPAQCQPETQEACCGFGLTAVTFAGIVSTSGDGTEGYVDRSCGNTAQVTEGMTYPISIGTGGTLDHDVIMWMDLDNSGAFEEGEEVWSALNQQDPVTTFMMPSASVFGVPLRLRIAADVVGQTTSACDEPFYGQMEDFSVVVTENTDPPIAAFSASPTTTCNGFVQFTDASLNAPDTWFWEFGDGTTSEEVSPLHEYLLPGDLTVSLTVTSANGTDTQTNTDYIHFIEEWICDTLQVPNGGPMLVETCPGILSDNGGPEAPYFPQSEAITIAPAGADVVTLIFSQFQWGNNDSRWLAIYDGPDVFSPLIDEYTGNGLGQLPNNGIITSSGPAITLRQEADGGGPPPNSAGFLLTWECGYTSIAEAQQGIANIWPQPAHGEFDISLAAPAPAGSRVEIHDALGALVHSGPIAAAATTQHINVDHLPAGPYILGISTGTARWNRTIMID